MVMRFVDDMMLCLILTWYGPVNGSEAVDWSQHMFACDVKSMTQK